MNWPISSDGLTGNMTEIAGQFQNLSEMTERPTFFVKTATHGNSRDTYEKGQGQNSQKSREEFTCQ